ncbi:MAG: hypothetical protein ACLU02_00095 [Clostridia bacterium]|jgi:hypothetical protein
MIENSLEGFIAVRDILLLAPAEEIVAMFNTEELQDYLLENINLLLNFDSHCLFLKKDMYEKLLLIVNNGRFKTEKVNRLTQINYAIIKINTEKCHNNSIEEMNSYILQQCKLRLGKRLTLEYMYDYKSLKETLLELMEYDADLLNSLKNRSLFINENNIFKILSSTAYMVTNFKENLENDNILSFIREETTTITNVLAIAKKTKMLTKELYKSGIEITDYINKEIKVPKIKQL